MNRVLDLCQIKKKWLHFHCSVTFLARLYESTGRAIAVTPVLVSASASALLKMLKFLVKVFMSTVYIS